MASLVARVRVAFLLLTALTSAAIACTTGQSKAGAGSECFLATDCEDGLVCVPQQNGGRVCSSDISRVTGQRPPEAGAGDAAPRDGAADAPVEDAPADSPAQDTGTDTGVTDTGAG